jgi:hypothetical protein
MVMWRLRCRLNAFSSTRNVSLYGQAQTTKTFAEFLVAVRLKQSTDSTVPSLVIAALRLSSTSKHATHIDTEWMHQHAVDRCVITVITLRNHFPPANSQCCDHGTPNVSLKTKYTASQSASSSSPISCTTVARQHTPNH